MRYQGTAIQIYDIPSPANPEVRFNRRMALILAVVGLLGLAAFLAFALFGIVSQRI
jgi:hypothetical protein